MAFNLEDPTSAYTPTSNLETTNSSFGIPDAPTVGPLKPSTSFTRNENIANTESSNPVPVEPNEKDCKIIGKIVNIRKEIDQSQGLNDRITQQLRLKMSVIDLIPCAFSVPVSTILNPSGLIDAVKDLPSKFIPQVTYQKSIQNFKDMTKSYGLPSYSFLRLYLTDATSVSDEMNNTYQKSMIDSGVNSLGGGKWQSAYQFAESMGASTPDIIKQLVKAGAKMVNVNADGLSNLADLAQQVLTHGTRIAFPKIWANSTYEPNISANLKLVSPYGHPKAINEFIIKPLCYILLLLSPTTSQGITTNRPSYLTLKSYGLSNLTLCYPGMISIQRGGDDNSYNNFNQPLTVTVSLAFHAVTEGFACFKNYSGKEGHPDTNLFGDNPISLKTFENDFTTPSALFPTLKNIVNSFRPFGYKKPDATSAVVLQTTDYITGGQETIINSIPDLASVEGGSLSLTDTAMAKSMSELSPPTNLYMTISGE